MVRMVCLFMVLLSPLFASSAPAREIVSTLADQKAVSVTIYNQDLALVRDSRTITMPPGRQTLAFSEISARIRPQTALLVDPDLQVLEQNFEYDLLSPQTLLEKYVGHEVMLVKTHPVTGEEVLEKARVLSAAGGVVLKVGDHIESGIPGRLIYPDVPDDLRDRPTLTMLVDSRTRKPQQVELSYLSGGLSWQADYVAELNADDTRLDLSGWVTLNNESGATYTNARLKLVAGDVNRVREEMSVRRPKGRGVVMAMADTAPNMAEESMFEYHLYSLDRPTTIREKQSKQVALMHAADVQVAKEFVLQGQEYYYRSRSGELGRHMKVGVFVKLENCKQAGLGQPLPAGVMRVYKKDNSGSLQFVGEDRIAHTAANETVRLKLGDAFDVTATKKQTAFKKVAGTTRLNNYVVESSYEIVLKNAKDESVTVRIVEPVPGDWKILEESAPHIREQAETAIWQLQVPRKSRSTLTYRVRIKY